MLPPVGLCLLAFEIPTTLGGQVWGLAGMSQPSPSLTCTLRDPHVLYFCPPRTNSLRPRSMKL